MWIAFGFLAFILALDYAAYRFGVDTRPGFDGQPESADHPRRSI